MKRSRRVQAVIFAILGTLDGCGKKVHDTAGSQGNSPALQPEEHHEYAEIKCSEAAEPQCLQARQAIKELQAKRNNALNAHDDVEAARVSLQLNHRLEELAMLSQGHVDQAERTALDSKYKRLAEIMEASLRPYLEKGPPDSGSATEPKKPFLAPSIIYNPKEVKAVAAVYAAYGPLYMEATPPGATSGESFQEASAPQPWSGYWYPLRGTELFAGDGAPLVKLDKALAAMGRPAATASSERGRFHAANADSWEGRCAAWAVAAVSSKEPKTPVTFQGVVFSPADQKALLTLLHEVYPTTVFGIRYDGDASTDGLFQSMRPEAFHRIFLTELGERRRAFIVNDDAGIEVWHKPVYRMRWTVRKDPKVDYAYLVTAMPFMTRNRNQVSDETTNESDRAAPVYEYRLYVDPAQSQDGQFKVIAGEWLNESWKVHPHYVVIPKDQGKVASANTEVEKVTDVVKKIVGLP